MQCYVIVLCWVSNCLYVSDTFNDNICLIEIFSLFSSTLLRLHLIHMMISVSSALNGKTVFLVCDLARLTFSNMELFTTYQSKVDNFSLTNLSEINMSFLT